MLTHPIPDASCSPSLKILAQLKRKHSKSAPAFDKLSLCNLSKAKLPVQFAYTTWYDMSNIIYEFNSYFQRWFEARFSKVFRHLDTQLFHLVSDYLFWKKPQVWSCPGPHVKSRTNPGPAQDGFNHHLLFILSNALGTVLVATTYCSAPSCLPDFAVCLKWLHSYPWCYIALMRHISRKKKRLIFYRIQVNLSFSILVLKIF